MSGFLAWCVSNVLFATLLAALAWLATRHRRPALGHALFALALVKLVTPAMVDLPLWAGSIAGPVWSTPAALVTATATTPGGPTAIEVVPSDVLQHLLLWAWALGSCIALGVATVRTVRLDRWLRSLRPASSQLQGEVAQLARRIGLRRPPLSVVVEAPISALACPSSRGPCLVLPTQLLARLSTAARETVLVHELAHLRRRDWITRVVEIAVVAAWWWLPLVYWMRRGLRRAEELCCDAWVLSILPDRGSAYAEALVTASSLIHRVPTPACGLGPIRQLKERLQMLERIQPITHRLGAAGRLLILTLAGLLLPIVACQSAARIVIPPPTDGDSVYLLGAVKHNAMPASTKGRGRTLLEAMTVAEPTTDADLGRVHLLRRPVEQARSPAARPDHPTAPAGKPLVIEVDVRAMITTGNTRHNVVIQAGDIIYVPRRGEPAPSIEAPGIAPKILANKAVIERGDLVCCLIDPSVLKAPGAEQLQFLTQLQKIGPDGTILCPYVGPIEVVGLKEREAAALLREKLSTFLAVDPQITVRISHAR